MKFTRRGLFGLLGGAAAAKIVDVKWLDASARHDPVHRPVPGFKITKEMGPPFRAGDVVRSLDNGMTFLVKEAEAARVKRYGHRILGMRGTESLAPPEIVERPADAGWKRYRERTGKPELVLVAFMSPSAPGMPLKSFDEGRLFRVGVAHIEARTKP